jgi:NADPH2:quinone reductase
MRALRFEKTGSLEFLMVQDIPRPSPGAGEVLINVKAAAVNPSDIKNVLIGMHETTLPRTPGRDFAGVVVEGPEVMVGKSVFGSGGNLGIGRDGSHAEFIAVPASAVLPMPKGLNFEQSAGIGVAWMTAWAALINAAKLRAGEMVLILGTTGAVGTAAASIARKLGARVLGTVRKSAELAAASHLPVDSWVNLETSDLPKAVREATQGRGADVIFDLVGGPMCEQCLASLARRGRQVAISSSPERRVSFDLIDFYHNESRLLGVDSLKLSFEEAGEILRQLTPGFESGEYAAPKVQPFPLADGPDIYKRIQAGSLKGKVVLVP